MKSKLKGALAVSLAIVLALVLGVAALPATEAKADPGTLAWSRTGTPNEYYHQLAPGTDLYDMAIGPDGDTVYVVGADAVCAELETWLEGTAEWTTDAPEGYSGKWAVALNGLSAAKVRYGETLGTLANIGPTEITFSMNFDNPGCKPYGFLYLDTTHDCAVDTLLISAAPKAALAANVWHVVTMAELGGHGTPYTSWTPLGYDDGALTYAGIDRCESSYNFQGAGSIATLSEWALKNDCWADAKVMYVGYGHCCGTAYVDDITIGDTTYDLESYGGILANPYSPHLWKSVNGGEIWIDYTAYVQAAVGLPADFSIFTNVAVPPDDGDFVAVAGYAADNTPMVVASQDGGAHFTYTGDMADTYSTLTTIYDMDIAPEVGGIHNIAVGGINDDSAGCVYRLQAGTWLSAAWEDTTNATFYPGWKPLDGAVTSVKFSTNFDLDRAIVTMGNDSSKYYLQTGSWEMVGGLWNLPDMAGPVEISDAAGAIVGAYSDFGATGIALPSDYDATIPPKSVVFVYVNGLSNDKNKTGGWVFRIDFVDPSPACGPTGDPELASIAYYGSGDSGKAMVGALDTPFGCNAVQVWRTAELDVCCPRWFVACKPPTGNFKALVAYTPDGEKAYAVTVSCESAFSVSRDDGKSWNQFGLIDTMIDCLGDVQVTLDCQKAYITSTNHDYCCACDSVWRSVIDDTHTAIGQFWERVLCEEFSYGCCCQEGEQPGLLRLPYDETDGETVYLGDFGSNNMWYSIDQGQCWMKTPPTKVLIQDFALEDERTVYVLDDGGMVSMSDAYGRHWTLPVNTLVMSGHTIAVMPEGNVLVGGRGVGTQVAYSSDSAATFSLTPPLDAQVAQGKVHIAFDNKYATNDIIYAAVSGVGIYRLAIGDAVWTDLNAAAYYYYGIVLGKSDGTLYAPYVAPTEVPIPGAATASGSVTVYDAVEAGEAQTRSIGNPLITSTGTFISGEALTVIGSYLVTTATAAQVEPKNVVTGTINVLGASSGTTGTISVTLPGFKSYPYPAGNTMTVTSSALLATVTPGTVTYAYEAGVARCLTPFETPCCDVEWWDYLKHISPTVVLADKVHTGFTCEPSALRISGCLTAATDSTLWAIDCCPMNYDMGLGLDGTVWQYTDCVAKSAPTLVAPADGAIIACDECLCGNAPFTLEWSRLCNACKYEVAILDKQFNTVYFGVWAPVPGVGGAKPSMLIGSAELGECAATYYWMVRVSEAETGEVIKSPWSAMGMFTIKAGVAGAIQLLTPDYDATEVLRSNVPFSWTAVPNATSYKFVLSANSDLSSPLAEAELSGTAYAYTGTLDYEASYFWQVTAMKDGDVISTSPVGTFTTELTPEEAPPPLPAPPEPTWPPYAWAIIAIGAALMVVVIVLIYRTRRVS